MKYCDRRGEFWLSLNSKGSDIKANGEITLDENK